MTFAHISLATLPTLLSASGLGAITNNVVDIVPSGALDGFADVAPLTAPDAFGQPTSVWQDFSSLRIVQPPPAEIEELLSQRMTQDPEWQGLAERLRTLYDLIPPLEQVSEPSARKLYSTVRRELSQVLRKSEGFSAQSFVPVIEFFEARIRPDGIDSVQGNKFPFMSARIRMMLASYRSDAPLDEETASTLQDLGKIAEALANPSDSELGRLNSLYSQALRLLKSPTRRADQKRRQESRINEGLRHFLSRVDQHLDWSPNHPNAGRFRELAEQLRSWLPIHGTQLPEELVTVREKLRQLFRRFKPEMTDRLSGITHSTSSAFGAKRPSLDDYDEGNYYDS